MSKEYYCKNCKKFLDTNTETDYYTLEDGYPVSYCKNVGAPFNKTNMSKGAINFSNDNEFYTPKWVLDLFGPFDYDPATTVELAKKSHIPNFDTIETNGLNQDWTKYKRIWINPPFTIKHLFFQKAQETYDLTKAAIFFLCPIEFLTTKRFHNTCKGATIYLPNGRLKFNKGGEALKSPTFGSVILQLDDGWYIKPIRVKE